MNRSRCGKARRALWPDGAPRVATGDVIDAQRHVERCAACRRFLAEMRRLATIVASVAPNEPAPADVRERLFTAIARERAGMSRAAEAQRTRVTVWIGAIATAVVLGFGVAQLRTPSGEVQGSELLATLADDHVRSARELHLASSDAALVTTWLEPLVPFAVHVPALPETRLRGARVVLVDGRRSAVIEYDVDRMVVSYFLIPRSGRQISAGGLTRLETMSSAGYQMVAWREPGVLHAMVGNMPSTRLARLAHACIEQMGGRVAWLRVGSGRDAGRTG